MAFFLHMSPRRLIIILALALAVVVAGAWTMVKVATDHLLYQGATATAQDWAHLLAETVTDLEQIANGEPPSTASMVFLDWARQTGQVFRYEIYNLQGFAQLAVQDTVAPVDLAERKMEAVHVLETGQPWVDLEDAETGDDDGVAAGFPAHYSEAFVPAVVGGRTVAVVAAYIDQGAEQARFQSTFLATGGALCLLAGFAFGIPAIAWYRRTREKQQADRRIRYLAHHDGLTGLTNRARLIEKLNAAMAGLADSDAQIALLFIDLDRFKDVNDTFGHDAGDFLLTTIAERLRAVTRRDDEVARLGGDEFVVLLHAVTGRGQVEEFTGRMVAAIAEPMRFNDQEIAATLSVGVAIGPGDGATPDRLLKSADLALYRSKADGRDRVRFFAPEMDAELMSRIALEKALRRALRDGGFELHYQPEYELNGRRLIGFEALIRLRNEDGTLLPPGAFLPLAEELRLIDAIGAWVLGEACRAAALWPEQLSVAVNVSPSQFSAGSVSGAVAKALMESGLAARRLELEITETHLLGDSVMVMNELHALKATGVAVVMGHFGTGPSSLSYLWRFPFDKIKIDRSFMKGFDAVGRDAETVVRTIVALGRALHMGVTVEGVETAGQMAFLEGVDADRAQGFYFSQPVPVTDVEALIRADAEAAEDRLAS